MGWSERVEETFLDERLPLHDRLARLATFLRSDAWSPSKFFHASELVCEAAERLRRMNVEDSERLRVFKHMDERIANIIRAYERTIYELRSQIFQLQQKND